MNSVLRQDLWNLGRMMGVEGFIEDGADQEAKDMERELSAARRRDIKNRKDRDDSEDTVMQFSRGDANTLESEEQIVMGQKLDTIRDKFRHNVIRRTLDSKSYDKKLISGLRKYQDHKLVMNLHDHEMDHLNELAEELAGENGTSGAMCGAGKVSDIYDDASFVRGCHSAASSVRMD
jgi:hypothetical protein